MKTTTSFGLKIPDELQMGKCELCGELDNLRPYGPNHENICYSCGMKDPAITRRRCMEYILKLNDLVVINPQDN